MDTWELVRCGQRLTADALQERSRRSPTDANVAAVVIVASVVTVSLESTVPDAIGVLGSLEVRVRAPDVCFARNATGKSPQELTRSRAE